MAAVSNHPATQSVKDSLNNGEVSAPPALIGTRDFAANSGLATQAPAATQPAQNLTAPGPVGQSVKAESAKTKGEFADLANARTTPDQPAATGQPLTRRHHPTPDC